MARIVKPRRTDFSLPDSHKPFTDKYFLRSNKILKKAGKNPKVKYRVFIQNGSGIACGLDEAIALIKKFAPNAKINALHDGEHFEEKETIMTIEGPMQDLIELETIYLGVISAGCGIASQMNEICEAAPGKDVFYFGSRHWRYDSDKEISYAAWVGGAKGVSTDIGAKTFGKKGMGTIPHSLILAFGDTISPTEEFCELFEKESKVIALVDTFNKEITDSLKVAKALGEKLFAVRIDTAGENFGENCSKEKGVSIELAHKVRSALDENNFEKVKIFLSSGFNPKKTKKFTEAEKEFGEFFDAIGTGSVFGFKIATSDIIEIDGVKSHKIGRDPKPTNRLKEVK